MTLDMLPIGKKAEIISLHGNENMKKRLGNKYIVFPNPMYGNWEKALYKEKDPCMDRKKLLDVRG